MFKLEEAMAAWRRKMMAGGISSAEVLDELESHLREEMRALSSSGTEEAEAFRLAVSRLGAVESIRAEFDKVVAPSGTQRSDQWVRWAGWMLIPAIALAVLIFRASPGALLMAHAVTLTGGYLAAFLAGGLGIYYVCAHPLLWTRPAREEALKGTAMRLVQISTCLVLAGLVFGVFWNRTERGQYLSGDPREIGTLTVLAWLTALWLIQRFGRAGTRAVMLLCIVGNVAVSLAWFGAGVVSHGNRIASYWPLNSVLGLNLAFLVMGALSRFNGKSEYSDLRE